MGLVDAVPDEAFFALARLEARYSPDSAGCPNIVTDVVTGQQVVGKLGWKGQVPNLLQFAADAYLNEMGITTPLFPDEHCPQGDCTLLACDPVPGLDDGLEDAEKLRDFMTFVAPPPPARLPSAGGSRGPRLRGPRVRELPRSLAHDRRKPLRAQPIPLPKSHVSQFSGVKRAMTDSDVLGLFSAYHLPSSGPR